MTARSPEKPPSFEKALERLETLVAEMEDGSLSLDKMMAHFEEGMSLVKLCSARLDEVERRIEILVKKGDTVATEPLEAGNGSAAPDRDGSANADADGDEPDR